MIGDRLAKGVRVQMIPDQNISSKGSIDQWYQQFIIRRSFSKIYVKNSPEINLSAPTLYLCNHHNWWDLFIASFINEYVLGQNAAYLVEYEEIEQQIGIPRGSHLIPLKIDSYVEMKENMDAGSEWLNQKRASLWLFTKGENPHQDYRPLRLLPGLGILLEKVRHVQVVPVSIYYTFEWEPRPCVYIHLGSPIMPSTFEKGNRRNWVSSCENALSVQLDELRVRVIHQNVEDFKLVLRGKSRIDEWMLQIGQQFFNKRKRGSIG